jgi:uncharacterized protein (TIGR02145 family)
MKSALILLIGFIVTLFLSCKTEEIILHGEIKGLVIDASTSQPIGAASVILNQSGDSTSTGSDGTYLLKSLSPGNYELLTSKNSYAPSKKNVTITPEETLQIDFSLTGIAVPNPSDTLLDFGFDSTTLNFTISNKGKGEFSYILTPSQNWITVNPSTGNIKENTYDSITVTVNRTGLSENTHIEAIKLTSVVSQGNIPDIYLDVYMNAIFDNRDNKHKYYPAVKIGTQTWMAENLNVGTRIDGLTVQQNNNKIEKYCYQNGEGFCDIYGGLYQWAEMMQYNTSDTATTGKTEGICPVGWHIPTVKEWNELENYLGGESVAGGPLKDKGTSHWSYPNVGATNESGFTALPGGFRLYNFPLPNEPTFSAMATDATFWTSSIVYNPPNPDFRNLESKSTKVWHLTGLSEFGLSVRCIKDPPKNK